MNRSVPADMALAGDLPDAGAPSARRTAGLTLAALGVVYGDIGTSPLYAVRESALAAGGHIPAAPAVWASCR